MAVLFNWLSSLFDNNLLSLGICDLASSFKKAKLRNICKKRKTCRTEDKEKSGSDGCVKILMQENSGWMRGLAARQC